MGTYLGKTTALKTMEATLTRRTRQQKQTLGEKTQKEEQAVNRWETSILQTLLGDTEEKAGQQQPKTGEMVAKWTKKKNGQGCTRQPKSPELHKWTKWRANSSGRQRG